MITDSLPSRRGSILCSAAQLRAIRVVQPSKVVPHCRQSQRLGELVVVLYQRLSKEAPKLLALTVNYSKLEHYARERHEGANDTVTLRLYKLLGRSFHRVKRSLIILTWCVNGPHDRLIALNQHSRIHASLKVQGTARVVS